MQSKFFALINRLKLINRWGLMHNRSLENVSSHSHQVAILAFALATIDREIFNRSTSAEKAASLAIFHDATEVLTGDMPTPVKYANLDITSAYKQVEKKAIDTLIKTLPEKLEKNFTAVLSPKPSRELELVKFADKLSALIKCIEEEASGNREFLEAKKSTLQILKNASDKTVDYFMENFLEGYSLGLDELLECKM